MKRIPTITPGPPVLDAETFQRLLAAAHILQECNDRRQIVKMGSLGLSDGAIAQNASVRITKAAKAPVPDRPHEKSIVHVGVEPIAPESDGIIPLGTARQLSLLASQLEAVIHHPVPSDPQWPVKEETDVPGHQANADQAGEKARFEQPQLGTTQLMPLGEVLSGTGYSPHRIVRKRIRQGNELFWTTATVFTVAAVLFLLTGVSVHPLSPLPGGVSLSSEVVQQQRPFHKTVATESLATKSAEPLVSSQPPAHAENSVSPENKVVKSNSLHSTFGSEAHLVAEENARVASEIENRIRGDRRLQMTRVQVRVSNGIVTLFGDVGSDAERVAAAQDAARIEGIEALVNNLQVITTPQSPTGTLPKPLASVTPILNVPAAKTSTAGAVNGGPSHGTTNSSSTQPTDSKVLSLSSRSSPNSISATPFSEPEQITLPYGTVLALRLTETLSSDLNQPGDTFLASLDSPIVIGDRVIVPGGADVKGKIVDARKARRFGGRSALVIEVTHLAYNGRTYELLSSQYSKQGASRNAYAAAAVTGGTGVGAIIGTVVGKGKGAAIGAVLGAAAGTGVQAVTKLAPAQLPAESTLSLRLEAPVRVTPSSTLQRFQSAGPDFSHDSFSSDDRPVLKHRAGSPPDKNTNTPTQHGPSPRHD